MTEETTTTTTDTVDEGTVEEHRYAKFLRGRRLCAYVILTREEYEETDVPDDAKWAKVNCKYSEDTGDLIDWETKSLPEFAPFVIADGNEVFMMLCAVPLPSYRHKRVTYTDLDQWDAYLQVVFNITFEEWLTYDEVQGLLPVTDTETI